MEKHYTKKSFIKDLYRLMYVSHNIFIKNHILYYVTGGTLLGAVRHKGIIPWDDDIDVEIGKNDIPTLLSAKVREQFTKEGYRVIDKRNTLGWVKIRKMGTGNQPDMDVFPVEIVKVKGKFRTEWVFAVGHEEWPMCYYDVNRLFPLKEYRFGKIYVLGPKTPAPALTRCYKSTWRNKGMITQDKDHLPLAKPIMIKTGQFTAGKNFYIPPKTKPQIRLKPDSPYLHGFALSFK